MRGIRRRSANDQRSERVEASQMPSALQHPSTSSLDLFLAICDVGLVVSQRGAPDLMEASRGGYPN